MILSGATILYEFFSFNSRDSCSFFRFRLCFHSAFRDCGAYTGVRPYGIAIFVFVFVLVFVKSKAFYKHFW